MSGTTAPPQATVVQLNRRARSEAPNDQLLPTGQIKKHKNPTAIPAPPLRQPPRPAAVTFVTAAHKQMSNETDCQENKQTAKKKRKTRKNWKTNKKGRKTKTDM